MKTLTEPSDTPVTTTNPDFRYRWLVLAVMLTAEVMDLFDGTVVNVAGPDLQRELGASGTSLQWVIGGYALTLGAGLIVGGRLGDRFGRRRMFLIGLMAFVLTSALSAAAPTIGLLVTFRLLQGAAGAILLPQGFGLLRVAFPPGEIGKAFAVFGPVFGLAGVAGPVIGGGLIQADIFGTGWRFVFLINLPLGIAAAVIAWKILPRTGGDAAVGIDLLGAAIIAVAAGLLVLPLVQGRDAGWPLWTWASLGAAGLGVGVFVFQQRRHAARGGTPLVSPGLFGERSYTLGLAGIALFFAGSVGTQLVLTLFLQIGQQFTAGQAGLGSISLAIGSGIGGAVSGGLLADKLGRSVLQIGATVQLLGAGWLFLALGQHTDFSIWQVTPGLTLAGVGSGLVAAALFNVVLARVADQDVGSGSGVLTAVSSIAAAIGVAISGTIFFAHAAHRDFSGGFREALIAQGIALVGFLILTPLFPRRARPDDL